MSDLLQAEDAPWSLRKAAWAALDELKVPLTARLRAAFAQACEKRLEETEAALFDESVIQRIDDLNAERIAILRQLAKPEHLPLLLNRRFRYGIHHTVRKIVDEVITVAGEPPEEARLALEILREDRCDSAVKRWWQYVLKGSGFDFLAAAHRLAALGKTLDPEPLYALLSSELDVDRISAVATLCNTAAKAELGESMEQLARKLIGSNLIGRVEGNSALEALTRLVEALSSVDAARKRRLGALALMIFESRRDQGGPYPLWHLVSNVELTAEDREAMLVRGSGDDVKAAILNFNTFGGGALSIAAPVSRSDVTEDNLECFREVAERETELAWQHRIAIASPKLGATGLLSLFLNWASVQEFASCEDKIYNAIFGERRERFLAGLLRVIGYLARLLLDSEHPADAADAVTFLHTRAATLADEEDRSIVVGCTTALGYLGEWEPILTYLGPGEPWMHRAADNVFTHWVSRDPAERERAARWIARRLRDHRDLAPEVRSTLREILELLEREIGRHVGVEE